MGAASAAISEPKTLPVGAALAAILPTQSYPVGAALAAILPTPRPLVGAALAANSTVSLHDALAFTRQYQLMPNRRPHSRDLRRHRYSIAGFIYLVTFRCRSRTPVFAIVELGKIVSDEILLSDRSNRTDTFAFVVMPDHVHWLFQLRSRNSLSSVVRRVKGRSAYRVNKARRSTGPLWQAGFHDSALRSDESLLDAGNYVIANPVRAGPAAYTDEYPLCGLMLSRIEEIDRGYRPICPLCQEAISCSVWIDL